MGTAIALLDLDETTLLLQISLFSLFLDLLYSAMPPRKRKGGSRKTAAGAAAVSAQDEEPERVEEGPQVTQGAQGTDDRQRVDDPPTGASKEKRPPLRLDLEQEGVVFEFVEAHQELYSKGHPDFLKTGHKLALWQQLADTLKATDFDGG